MDVLQNIIQVVFAVMAWVAIGCVIWKIGSRLRHAPRPQTWASRSWLSRGLRLVIWGVIGFAAWASVVIAADGYRIDNAYDIAKLLAVVAFAAFFVIAALALAYRTWPGLFNRASQDRLGR